MDFEEKKRGEISHEKTPRIFDEKRQQDFEKTLLKNRKALQ